MKTKRIGAIVLCTAMAMTSLVGCKKEKVANDENTLEIYAKESGYGVEWLYKVAEEFKKEYPEYNVVIETEKAVDRAADMLTAGPEITTADLLFVSKLTELIHSGKNGLKGYDNVAENLTEMYNTTVPGEDVKLKDKANKDIMDMTAIEVETSEGVWEDQWYTFAYESGLTGIVYNKTMFEEKGVAVPRTTEELYDVCDDLKTNTFAPLIGSFSVSYLNTIASIWWAQYEGKAEFERFWNPTSLSDYETIHQKGRLYSFQIQNQLYKKDFKRLHKDTLDLNYSESQARFITREAAMLFCGGWFENEMKPIIEENQAKGNNDEYSMMKTPVNSAIVDKLSFWDSTQNYSEIFQEARSSTPNQAKLQIIKDADAKLLQIIDYVDGVTTEKPSFASDTDIAIVREARNLTCSYGSNSQGIIPVYATAKEAAKKFLLFLATDKMQKVVAQNCSGAVMPYGYDPTQDSEVQLSSFALDVQKIMNDSTLFQHYSSSKGEWLIGLTASRINRQRFAVEGVDYVTPEHVWEDSLIDYSEYQRLLTTAKII